LLQAALMKVFRLRGLEQIAVLRDRLPEHRLPQPTADRGPSRGTLRSALLVEVPGWDSDRIVLHDVPWHADVRLNEGDSNRHVRMSSSQENSELMWPRYRREKCAAVPRPLVRRLAAGIRLMIVPWD
jgi:hypothetical protein